jgi:hypothetical protein
LNCCSPRDDWWSIDDENFKNVMHVLQASIGAMKIRVKNELPATRLFLPLTKTNRIRCKTDKYSNNSGDRTADVYQFNGQLFYRRKKSAKLTIVI